MRIAYVMMTISPSLGRSRRADSIASALKGKLESLWLKPSFTKWKWGDQFPNLAIQEIQAKNVLSFKMKCVARLNELTDDYDLIIMRYPLWDPFLMMFLKHKNKIVSEHHTFDWQELKFQNDIRTYFEKFLGSRLIGQFAGVTGVTQEIADYEKQRAGGKIFSVFTPNTIDTSIFEPPQGKIIAGNTIKLIMVASKFMRWHGLSELIQTIKNDIRFELAVVGNVEDQEEIQLIEQVSNVTAYGQLNKEEIEQHYKVSDVALCSMIKDPRGLRQLSTLKVREYLGNGLPVVAVSSDPAFPDNFIYHQQLSSNFDKEELYNVCMQFKDADKHDIHRQAIPFIDSHIVWSKKLEEIKQNFLECGANNKR